MTDIAVIILVGREKLHMRRCLERLRPLEPKQVFVVESQPSDGTHEIAVEMGATTVFHKWPGLYAQQFNWALDNLPISATWILRLDADEYLTPKTIEMLKASLPKLPSDVSGLTLELKRRFMGGDIHHGTSGIVLLRVFRHGIGRCEERAMDEHIQLSEGRCVAFDGVFYDDNLNDFEWWKEKHRGYARREALDAVQMLNEIKRGERILANIDKQAATKRRKKYNYYSLPPYFRAFAYFLYRYFARLGFLDGLVGFRWHFWQGLWYRWLVDREIGRLLKEKGRAGCPQPAAAARGRAATPSLAIESKASDIAVIILAGRERLHMRRCLDRLRPLEPKQVFVVESQPSDGTHEIAVEMGATTVFHEWPGCQARQFNWALDSLPIEAKWVLRLDADEYLTDESAEWLRLNIDDVGEDVSALEFTLERKFSGHVIRHGTNGIKMVRMFRKGQARYSQLLMDEYVVFDGKKLSVPVVFFDDNLSSIEDWKEKHRTYAKREAEVVLSGKVKSNRLLYYKCPPYFRAVVYFCIRYFFKLGFLDGVAGWRWHFWQGLWYRWRVDSEIRKAAKMGIGA